MGKMAAMSGMLGLCARLQQLARGQLGADDHQARAQGLVLGVPETQRVEVAAILAAGALHKTLPDVLGMPVCPIPDVRIGPAPAEDHAQGHHGAAQRPAGAASAPKTTPEGGGEPENRLVYR